MRDELTNEEALDILKSKVRGVILRLMMDNKTRSISDLHRQLTELYQQHKVKPFDYKAVYKQVLYLEKKGFLKTKQLTGKQGKPVMVKRINAKSIRWNMMEEVLRTLFKGLKV